MSMSSCSDRRCGLVLALLAGGAACSPPAALPTRAPEAAPALVKAPSSEMVVSDEVQAPAILDADLSLSEIEYVHRGMPTLTETWAPERYQQATNVLVQLANERRSTLPRQGSAKSGAVFEKLTREDTFVLGTGRGGGSTPMAPAVGLGVERARAYLKPVSALIAVYAPADETGDSFSAEQVELTVVSLVLLEPLVVDPQTPETVAQNLSGSILAGGLSMVAQYDKYSASERLRLAKSLADRVKPFAEALGPVLLPQAHQRAQQLASAERDAKVQVELHRVVRGLEAAEAGASQAQK